MWGYLRFARLAPSGLLKEDVLKSIRCAEGDRQGIKVAWVAEVRGAAAVADEVVVVDCVEVESPVLVDEITQPDAANEAGIETAIFARELAHFIEIIEEYVIVCHPICFAFSSFLQPIPDIATEHCVAAEMLAAEGEIGQHGQHQVEVVVLRVEGV